MKVKGKGCEIGKDDEIFSLVQLGKIEENDFIFVKRNPFL